MPSLQNRIYFIEKNVTLWLLNVFTSFFFNVYYIFLCLKVDVIVQSCLDDKVFMDNVSDVYYYILLLDTCYTLCVTLARHCDRLQACSEFTVGGYILYRV